MGVPPARRGAGVWQRAATKEEGWPSASGSADPGPRPCSDDERIASASHTGLWGSGPRFGWPRVPDCCTTRALSPEARLQHPRAEIFPAMTWGSGARHLRPEVIGVAETALVRMVKLLLQLFRPEGEPWLDWHIRTCRYARERLVIAWGGEQPAAVIVECVVSGTDCSVVGRVIRWGPVADREAMSHLSGGRSGLLSRGRVGRLCMWWEDPLCQPAGSCLQGEGPKVAPKVVAKELRCRGSSKDELAASGAATDAHPQFSVQRVPGLSHKTGSCRV